MYTVIPPVFIYKDLYVINCVIDCVIRGAGCKDICSNTHKKIAKRRGCRAPIFMNWFLILSWPGFRPRIFVSLDFIFDQYRLGSAKGNTLIFFRFIFQKSEFGGDQFGTERFGHPLQKRQTGQIIAAFGAGNRRLFGFHFFCQFFLREATFYANFIYRQGNIQSNVINFPMIVKILLAFRQLFF